MCGFNSNKGKGVNKLLAPYDISEASIRHKLVSFGKEPLYSDRPTPLIIEVFLSGEVRDAVWIRILRRSRPNPVNQDWVHSAG